MATEYDEGRCWYKKSGKRAVLGVTASALDEVGQIEKVTLPVAGDAVEEGDVIAEIEGSLSTLEIVAPLAGMIQQVNENLEESPEMVAEDPLDEGWLIRMKVNVDSQDEESDENDSDD
jgi:glycine cleavage system H protein